MNELFVEIPLIEKTAAQWAVDVTVYPTKRILITSDVFYGATDQKQFKITDGIQTWSGLDYMPIYSAAVPTLAQVLNVGDNVNQKTIVSLNNLSYLQIFNDYFTYGFDDGTGNDGSGIIDATSHRLYHSNGIDLQSPSVTKNGDEIATENYVNGLVSLTFHTAGSWDASGNTFPITGTGAGGVIRSGDTYNTTVAGTPAGFPLLDVGDNFYALVDAPGQIAANWAKFETNTQQSTEVIRGTAKIVTQAIIEDENTGNDTDIVTGKKFWMGIFRFLALAWTWNLKQTFLTAPRFSSENASQYLKTNATKDVTTVSTIPAADVAESVNLRFQTDAQQSRNDATSSIQTQLDSKAGITTTQTLTNKRITKRVVAVASSATPTFNSDNGDIAQLTGLNANITNASTNLTGTPTHGQLFSYEITDNGTARTISWGASFSATGTLALPTTTVISTLLRSLFQWNSVTSKWEIVAVV